ncbi:MAG TPA: hypothetical protein VG273_09465 [Bryobacteraceae bacterium]|jgi:hypothetical protein|nr:hypothetical protein [Bryobacteraceae bacterium]
MPGCYGTARAIRPSLVFGCFHFDGLSRPAFNGRIDLGHSAYKVLYIPLYGFLKKIPVTGEQDKAIAEVRYRAVVKAMKEKK